MVKRFDGQAGAFAYLLFILLYFPCVATIGAIAREAGGFWAAFVAFWSTSLAYVSAGVFYQLARFTENPGPASVTLVLLLAYALALFMGLRGFANRKPTSVSIST